MTMIARWEFNEGKGKHAREEITGSNHPIHYIFNNGVYKEASWRKGLTGNALFFDGYSTWVDCGHLFFEKEFSKFSIEVWVAPRATTLDHGQRGERLLTVITWTRRKVSTYAYTVTGLALLNLGREKNGFK